MKSRVKARRDRKSTFRKNKPARTGGGVTYSTIGKCITTTKIRFTSNILGGGHSHYCADTEEEAIDYVWTQLKTQKYYLNDNGRKVYYKDIHDEDKLEPLITNFLLYTEIKIFAEPIRYIPIENIRKYFQDWLRFKKTQVYSFDINENFLEENDESFFKKVNELYFFANVKEGIDKNSVKIFHRTRSEMKGFYENIDITDAYKQYIENLKNPPTFEMRMPDNKFPPESFAKLNDVLKDIAPFVVDDTFRTQLIKEVERKIVEHVNAVAQPVSPSP